ncbi:hypothetical protein KR038_005127, partial [Drosophila bunnanda]
IIAQYLGDEPQNTSDQLIPEILLAVNSSVSDTTGFSSTFLVQGREPRLPNTLYNEVTSDSGTTLIPPEKRSQRWHSIFKVSHDNAERAIAEKGWHYNLRRREWRPVLGALVLVCRHALSNADEGFAAKLAAKYDRPYQVVKFLSPNKVRLKDPTTRPRRTASINNLKPYHQPTPAH